MLLTTFKNNDEIYFSIWKNNKLVYVRSCSITNDFLKSFSPTSQISITSLDGLHNLSQLSLTIKSEIPLAQGFCTIFFETNPTRYMTLHHEYILKTNHNHEMWSVHFHQLLIKFRILQNSPNYLNFWMMTIF